MSIVDKVKGMFGGHTDKDREPVDKETSGKYADEVDMAQEKSTEHIDSTEPKDTDTPPTSAPPMP